MVDVNDPTRSPRHDRPDAENRSVEAAGGGCPYGGETGTGSTGGPRVPATTASGTAHVEDTERTGDFDSHDPALAEDPFPAYARLRSRCPVSWSEAWGGFWVAAGHAEASRAGREGVFRTGHLLPDGTIQGVTIPPLGQTGRLVPLEADPPRNLKYRKLLSSFYSAGRVRARMPEFRRLARESLDAVISQGTGDLVTALTLRVPGIVTMRDLGLPDDRWFEMDSLVHRALLAAPHDLPGARAHAQQITMALVEELDVRQEHGSDSADRSVLPALIEATVDGEPVSDEDILSMLYLILLGIDPVSSLTATALLHLAEHPRLRDRLIADPSLVPRAAEEYARWMSPVQGTSRTAGEDTELGGRTLRAGERVFVSWASANRDEAVFPHPDTVDLDRDTAGHLAFGAGPHYCLGASLVRALFTVMLEEVLTRIPDYRVSDRDAVTWFPDITSFYGVTSLPIQFTPQPARIA
ncbi:cytochrome P450 [Streptomyces sp. NPDC090083]|uniref:cytochrome P450 n=1 Tax=Streptomyces sp. NPDC090083 TaxID=3365941 RepID=UPI00381B44BC